MRRWTESDVLLYALAVGAGQDDPLTELKYTTENTDGKPLQVLPTVGNLIVSDDLGDLGLGLTHIVHAEQGLTVHRHLPVAGSARSVARVTGIYDEGRGALVAAEATAVDAVTDEPLVTATWSLFVRGEGGFGGSRGPRLGPRAALAQAG